MKEHVELEKAIVEKIDPDILVTRYRPNAEVSESDAIEIDNAHLTMSQGKDMFIIADMSADSAHLDKSAEDYFIHKGRMIPYTKAIAIVSFHKSSFLSRLFGASHKTLYPTKEFDTIEEANQWFNTLRN